MCGLPDAPVTPVDRFREGETGGGEALFSGGGEELNLLATLLQLRGCCAGTGEVKTCLRRLR